MIIKLLYTLLALLFSYDIVFPQTVVKDTTNYFILVKTKLPKWIDMLKSENNKFDENKFFLKGKTTLKSEIETTINDMSYLSNSGPENIFFLYSPDSTIILDIYSQRHVINSKNGKLIIEGGDPDSQVDLKFIKDKLYRRYDCEGTLTEYNDCFWVNNSTFIVAGNHEIYDKNYFQAFFRIYDMKNNIRLTYASNVYFSRLPNYMKIKFSECIIK